MRFEHFPFTFRSIRIGKRISTFSKKNKKRKKDKGLILAPKKPKDSEDDEAS